MYMQKGVFCIICSSLANNFSHCHLAIQSGMANAPLQYALTCDRGNGLPL